MTLDWLIIGGGIHGVHIAARLIGEAGVAPDRLRIVDPGERLLARWRDCTATTGMTHLRSPSVHHIDLEAQALSGFADRQPDQDPGRYAPPYRRPAVELFNAHCEDVIERFDLAALHLQARAAACTVDEEEVAVELVDGRVFKAHHLVLAIGASEQPAWPDWAPAGDARVHHVFAPEFDGWPTTAETVAVVGGGISAGQVALRLIAEGHRVHVIARHALREAQFDSDPGWLGPKYMVRFSRETDIERRRSAIVNARNVGSAPPEVCAAVREAIADGQLSWHEGEVDGLEVDGAHIQLHLSTAATLPADRVLLATGFAKRRPGGAMVDALIESAKLPCARCGYPIVDAALRWHPRVHVSGPLAELELGPAARNIAGARRAGDRLVDAIRADETPGGTAVERRRSA